MCGEGGAVLGQDSNPGSDGVLPGQGISHTIDTGKTALTAGHTALDQRVTTHATVQVITAVGPVARPDHRADGAPEGGHDGATELGVRMLGTHLVNQDGHLGGHVLGRGEEGGDSGGSLGTLVTGPILSRCKGQQARQYCEGLEKFPLRFKILQIIQRFNNDFLLNITFMIVLLVVSECVKSCQHLSFKGILISQGIRNVYYDYPRFTFLRKCFESYQYYIM